MFINEIRNRQLNSIYNIIQLKTKLYCYIYVIYFPRMNVLVYNNHFDIWILYKTS